MPAGVAFALGLAVGGGLTYLAVRFLSPVYDLGKNLVSRAKGDLATAYKHVLKLV